MPMGQVDSFANSGHDLAESLNIGQQEVLERALGKMVLLGKQVGVQFRSDDPVARIRPDCDRFAGVPGCPERTAFLRPIRQGTPRGGPDPTVRAECLRLSSKNTPRKVFA
jgi:hypothetical protein